MSEFEIKDREFNTISTMIHNLCGINLHLGKKELVRARLSKRLRLLKLKSFSDYIDYISNDPKKEEFTIMVDLLSTNLTSFFRERTHFDFLKNDIIPLWGQKKENNEIRIWSAGCSSGEELYTLAIVVKEAHDLLKGKDIKILGTDISTRMLKTAKEGIYSGDRIKKIPTDMRQKYFSKVRDDKSPYYSVKPALRELVRIGRLNLLSEWPMKKQFDMIMCRNVMIYFDKPTQNEVINRFWKILKHEGYLMVGHSESLAGVKHMFSYVRPTIYKKNIH